MTTITSPSDGRGFAGTDNPRALRVIHALLLSPITREQLDRIAGCSNGPELVAQLRRLGLEIPCPRVKKKDRDGVDVLPGVYHFTDADRCYVQAWLAEHELGVAS
jgi:hypothetical protein